MNRTLRLVATAATAALLASCGDSSGSGTEPAGETPHGYVEGAEETAEAQSRLVVADAGSGALSVVDLTTEQVTELGTITGVRGLEGDGRYGYLTTADGSVEIVDSGSWTVDHGDHVHHYRSSPRDVGTVPAPDLVGVHSDAAVSALSLSDGSVVLLDRRQLDKGTVTETGRITGQPHPAIGIPYEEHILTSVAEQGQRLARGVEVRARDGGSVTTIGEPCHELQGAAVTRRGVVFGCADGALLVTEDEGGFQGTKIPYPHPVPPGERATEFSHRTASTTLAARAGDTGVWLLDVSRRTWNRLPTGPAVAVNAVGEGAPLLTLTGDGTLHAIDPESGKESAAIPLLPPAAAQGTPAPTIHIDTARAYVNNPSGGELYEIDYNDNLRLARTLTVKGKASYVTETGR